ncbi:bZIP transcription factor [Fibrisoma montanum]|uniref:BZIP transcription factor n=1 Tax=Fibrisoma montanum TaxID=2305895 RepID=A0A418M5N6_9BACT|nr:bZIP transcription factor [Fibrisoma montanum]RIV21220.1 bZIP transcription factor [Fibrisoma montanum]
MKLSTTQLWGGVLLAVLAINTVQAQVIEPIPGQSLTITEDVSLNANKSLRVADTIVLKTTSATQGNLFLGLQAGRVTTGARNNTFLGTAAGLNSNAEANTFIGFSAGRANTSGQFNTFVGVQAGLNNTTGNSNFIMGTNAGLNNISGTANFFLGDNAGGSNITGGFNVYLGANAGNGTDVNGSNNVSIGFESGRANSGGINNTFVGFRADAGAPGLQNATAIGNNARVLASNAVVLGNEANVGIGVSAPTARLHVASGITNQSGIRLQNLTAASPAPINSSKFLTVDASGNVVLANYAGGGRQGATDNTDVFWQRKGSYLQSMKDEAIVIGQNVSKMPTGYKLFVADGILTEKVKVAIKNTADWSDKVFAPTYRLQSLAEVEQFIQTHQHLPGVPSAEEVVKQGVDVGQMDAKLLEKIEELTLYSIQLQKENQQQAEELKTLKKEQAEMKQLLQEVLRRK